jgi:hypothetical protein
VESYHKVQTPCSWPREKKGWFLKIFRYDPEREGREM